MTSPAAVIRQLLIDLGLGSATSDEEWPVFTSFLPDVSNFAICVYDTPGHPDGRIMATGERIIHPGIQIRVIATIYETGRAKAEAIALALDGTIRTNVVISSEESYLVHNVSRMGSVLSLGVPEEGDRRRHHFTVNAVMTVTTN